MTVVLMFPGQSSRYPGMLERLAQADSHNAALLERASERLGRDLAHHYRSDNEHCYERNRDVQVGVFLANHMFLGMLERRGIEAVGSLGLSLGEWNHLVHIEALDFDQALEAVEARGGAYDAGPRGAMASVFPMELDELEQVAQRARSQGVLEVVNLNSPRQQVLSGEHAAIDAALAILEEEHYVAATVIERQVPMHSSLFEPVGTAFREHLETLSFATPRLPYLPNRSARFEAEPDWCERLSSHVHRPVLWRRSVERAHERWPDATLLEVGAKRVLTNLLDKRWIRGVRKAASDTREDLCTHLDALAHQLTGSDEEWRDAVG